ncbi:MAG: hypothetical protein JNM26_10465 [Ideonella sp.]|nr:hypothetical protein [Ideonella sp.]
MAQQRIGTNALPLGIGAGLISFAAGFAQGFDQAADAGLHALGIVATLSSTIR